MTRGHADAADMDGPVWWTKAGRSVSPRPPAIVWDSRPICSGCNTRTDRPWPGGRRDIASRNAFKYGTPRPSGCRTMAVDASQRACCQVTSVSRRDGRTSTRLWSDTGSGSPASPKSSFHDLRGSGQVTECNAMQRNRNHHIGSVKTSCEQAEGRMINLPTQKLSSPRQTDLFALRYYCYCKQSNISFPVERDDIS